MRLYPTAAIPVIMINTAKVTGRNSPALNPTYQRVPSPASRAPHPRTIERGAPYGLLPGGIMIANRASYAPKIAKDSGNPAASDMTPINESIRKAPNIIRNTPRLSGVHGIRITTD